MSKEKTDEKKREREKVTVQLPADLVKRARNAAYWSPKLTVAGIVEEGLKLALRRIESKGQYPPREGELKRKRPENGGRTT